MVAQTLTRESAERLVREWFKKVDRLDVDGTVSLCDDETVVTFGNQPGVKGNADLREMFSGFYNFFDKMHHEFRDISVDIEHNSIFIESKVGYYIKGNKEESPVTVPALTVMRLKSSEGQLLFRDFRVFFDLSPVMAMIMPHQHAHH